MSQRVKKPGRSEESQGKRRRRRPSGGGVSDADPDEDGNSRSGSNSGGGNGSLSGMWTPRHLNDLKVSSIYNRNSAEAPAELYRKDLISAMKLADSEPLTPEEFWLITDPWKQEWEKGVQVPVNPESLPEPEVVVISPVADRSHDFRLPKKKYVRVTHDDFFNPDYHQLVSTAARAEKVCSYDLDDVDAAWLGCCNSDRGMQTLPIISEFLMEQVIEELELQCWEQVQTILKSQEGLGIEYDENVICDVCRSPESEEGNEMVFCDSCNICVHQACYGITTIPSGSWLCRTCTLGIRPSCVLCPNIGGAMKATRSGHKWAHVACAIWILEVSFGSVEKMEPITKISSIPQSRWSLVCVLCKEKVGACIQCSVKSCKTAYHVTCAFKNGLEMKPIIVDENAEDGIKLRSYCQKHSVNTKKDKSANSGSEEDIEKKKERAMTAEERNLARAEKLQLIEAEFYKYVRLKDVSQNLAVDMDIVNLIYNYWKLKRKSLNNRPLVPPRPETTQLLTQQQEQDLEQMKMFVQLRQDLERVRNLCYMVSRREKLSRTFFRLREQTFQKQVALLGDLESLAPAEKAAILDANHGPAIYDKCYSHAGVTCNYKDYDALVNLIVGLDKKDMVNGAMNSVKGTKGRGKSRDNPYKKTFVNGARRRNILGESCSSVSESESILSNTEDGQKNNNNTTKSSDSTGRKPLSYLFDTDSSNDESGVIMSTGRKNPSVKTIPAKGRGLKQMEKMLDKSSTSDSELDLPPSSTPVSNTTTTTNNNNKSVGKRGKRENIQIYSDTESEKSTKPAITTANNLIATKGALKEFTGKKNKEKLNNTKNNVTITTITSTTPIKTTRGRGKGKAATSTTVTTTTTGKRKKAAAGFDPTELIVPQREAAKKASESIRSVKSRGKDQSGGQEENPPTPEPSNVATLPSTIKDSSPLTPTINSNLNKESKMNKSKESILITDFDEESQSNTISSKNKKNLEKKKVGRKNSQRGGKNNNNMITTNTNTKGIEPVKTEYDFDEENSSSGITNLEENNPKSVSYVPQRQAAKKAAEHIRSGLSNIVAARLIIEDEMEASRKKAKGEKVGSSNKKGIETTSSTTVTTTSISKSSNKSGAKIKPSLTELFDELRQNNMRDEEDNEDEDDEEEHRVKLEQPDDKGDKQNNSDAEDMGLLSKKVTQKERNLLKGGDVSRTPAMRGGKKEKVSAATSSATSSSNNNNNKEVRKDTDWPFLELGSQSVCRRSSRERSSSSSSSGSSSSSASSTSRSSSSSRSSSPESASPERNHVTTKSSSSPVIPTTPIKSLTQSSSICASPGRKLKTSERTTSRVGTKTPKRKEPPTKGSGGSRSKKSGSRRSSVTVEESSTIFSPEYTSPTRRTPSSTTTTTTATSRQFDTITTTTTTKDNVTPISRTNKRQRKLSTGANDGPTRNNSHNNNKNNKAVTTSPQSRRLSSSSSPTKTKCPQEKGKRRTRESKISKNDEDQQQSQSEAIPTGDISTTPTPTTSGSNKTRASPKALKKFELDLSSDSEPDLNSSSSISKTNTTTNINIRNKSKSPKSSITTPTTTTTTGSTNETVKHKAMPKTKKKQLGLLSESEGNSDIDEKENSCIPPSTTTNISSSSSSSSSPKKEHSTSTTSSSSSSPKKVGSAQKPSVPAGNITTTTTNSNVMSSPLIPSFENKEKAEQYTILSTDSEPPESKRARLDTSLTTNTSNKTTLLTTDTSSILIDSVSELTSTQSSSNTTNTTTLNAASTTITNTTASGINNNNSATAAVLMKSIFSPPGSGRGESEMLEFDSDLYDLARSVTDEVYSQHGDGEDGGSGSLSFSFSKDFLSREDNKEDSAMATLNLVEKLRLQHARKSGTNHRPSTESSSDIGDSILDGDGQIVKSPISSSTIEKDELISNTSTSSSSGNNNNNNNNSQLISNKQGQDSCSSSNNNNNTNNSFFEETVRSKTPVSVIITSESPSRTKSIQGDERWIPPSTDQVGTSNNSTTSIPQQQSKNQVQVPPQPSSHPIGNKNDSSIIIPNTANILHSRTSSKDNIMEEDAFNQQQQQQHQQQHLLHHQLQNQNQIEKMKQDLLNSSVSTPEFNNFMHNENNIFIPSSNSTINQQQQHYDAGQYSQSPISTTTTTTANTSISSSSSSATVSSNSIMSPSLIGNMSQINSSNNNNNNPHAPFLYPNQFFPPAQSITSTTTGIPKTSPSLTTTPTSFSPNTFPPHFLSQQQQQQQSQISPLGNPPSSMTVPPSLSSPMSTGHSQKSQQQQQRRPSDIGIDSNNSSSSSTNKGGLAIPSSIVAANTMLPLSKPPLSSPSILLAASNAVKIIENVVNNHSGNPLQKQPSLLSNIPLSHQTSSSPSSSSATTSFIPTSKQQQQLNVLNSFTELSSGKSPNPQQQQPLKGIDSSDFSAVLSTKTENIITPKYHHTPRHDHSVVPVSNSSNTNININNISNANTISPKGRGKRPSTPRGKTEKMVVVEQVAPPIVFINNNSSTTTTTTSSTTTTTTGKGKGRGARSDKNTSPSRGGHHNNTNRRSGGGRGRGKGKNSLVGVRKDLAGTVYDIDFDEFENTEEKFDLRMLRERRKSSDVFSEVKKSESSNTNASPVPHFEKNSPRFPRNNFDPHHHHHHQHNQHRQGGAAVESINNNNNNNNNNSCSSTNTRNIDKMLPIIQAPLPGPVDMRTYNASITSEPSNDILGSFSHKDRTETLFNASSVNTGMNDLEELDKTLDALASSSSSSSSTTIKSLTASSNLLTTTSTTTSTTNQISLAMANQQQQQLLQQQQQQQMMVDNQQQFQQQQQHRNTPSLPAGIIIGGDSSLSKDSMDTSIPTASILSSEGGDSSSRNQLKVKIKGPFLDANYSSNSIPPPHHHHHHHHAAVVGMGNFPPPLHPSEPSYHHSMMNVVNPSMINNTSNLRRMRKKELLRQYWTQDMNMDGSTFNPSPYSMGHHPMIPTNPSSNHPLNRSVIPNLTIPKAVASMSIIPTKDDYRMDYNMDDPMNQQLSNVPLPPPLGKETKKRRNRGGSREVAALGILTDQSSGPRERRRDRAAANSLTTPEQNSRKRARTSKPFIPPTLVESHEENSSTVGGDNSTGNNGSSGANNNNNNNSNNQPHTFSTSTTTTTTVIKPNATSSVVNAVSHPTPKLKIKFGSEQTASVSTVNNNSMNSNSNSQLSDSDKETPNKKAKGRPPKKRGLNTVEILPPPTMEEYKRQSMKYAEKIMQSFASERQVRRHKKHKSKKGRSGESETDDSNRSRSLNSEVVTDLSTGSKLILRFKSRTNPATNSQQITTNDETSNIANETSSKSSSNVNDGNSKVTTKGLPDVDLLFVESSSASLSKNNNNNSSNNKSKENGPISDGLIASSLSNNNNNNNNSNNKSSNKMTINTVHTLSDDKKNTLTILNKNNSRIDGDLVEHDSGFNFTSGSSEGSVVGVGASTSTFSGSLLNKNMTTINTKTESTVQMTTSSSSSSSGKNNNNNNNSKLESHQSYTSKITTASSSNNNTSCFVESESGKSNNIDTLASNSVSEGNDSKSIEKIKPIKLKINIKKKNINIPIKIIN